jgi:hypothetical protein
LSNTRSPGQIPRLDSPPTEGPINAVNQFFSRIAQGAAAQNAASIVNVMGLGTAGNTLGTSGGGSGSFAFGASNNITASQSDSPNRLSHTVMLVGPTLLSVGVTNSGNSAGTSGAVATQYAIVASRNLTASQSVSGQSATLTLLGPPDQTLGLYGVSQTTGQSSSSTYDARSISIRGAGIVSVGNSGGEFIISATGGQSVQTIGAYGVGNTTGESSSTTFDARTVSLHGAGAASVGYSAGSAIVSVPVQSAQTVGGYFSSNTTAQSSSSTFDARSLTFRGMGIASVGASAGEIVISVPAGGGAGDGVNIIAAGTRTAATTGTVLFSDANGVSFGLNAVGGSVLTATVKTDYLTTYTSPVSGTGPIDVSSASANGTNTSQFAMIDHVHRGIGRVNVNLDVIGGAGDTTNFYGNMSFRAGNNISFSTGGTADANGAITIHAGGGGGAATISSWPMYEDAGAFNTAILHTGSSAATGGSTQFTGSIRLYSLPFPFQLELNDLVMAVSAQATSAGTGSATNAVMLGIYSLNGNSALSLHKSYVWGHFMSQNSLSARTHRQWFGTNSAANTTTLAGNVSASFSGPRQIALNSTADTWSAHPGGYYVGVMVTQRTSSVNVYGLASMYHATGSQTSWGSFMGRDTFAPGGFQGIVSTTTNTNVVFPGLLMPGSIHTSAITQSGGTTQHLDPYVMAYRRTTA